MFWTLNKQTEKAAVIGSITAVAKQTGINKAVLYYNFSKLKKLEYTNSDWRIVKTELIRTKNK